MSKHMRLPVVRGIGKLICGDDCLDPGIDLVDKSSLEGGAHDFSGGLESNKGKKKKSIKTGVGKDQVIEEVVDEDEDEFGNKFSRR